MSTYEDDVLQDLADAGKEYALAKRVLEDRQKVLRRAVITAMELVYKPGSLLTIDDIAKLSTWTRAYIRTVTRAAGMGPLKPGPKPGRKAAKRTNR